MAVLCERLFIKMSERVFLSVVVPSKNEEANISSCLDSILKNVSAFKEIEIILADCDSKDKTIEIARNYPIKILRLKPNWPHSPAAARYIGAIFASGEFIFFIDADMTLEYGFLEKAMDILKKDKYVAGVGGIGKEIYIKNNIMAVGNPNLYRSAAILKKATFLGGAGLYRKQAIQETGGFNPYLKAGEENELAQRLRKKGYYLISIPEPMITHYTVSITEWQEFIRKKKMGMFLGIGQAMRLSCGPKYICETLFYYREFTLFLLFALFAGLIPLNSCLLLLYLWFRKKNFKNAILSLVKWFSISADIIHGLFMRLPNPAAYPQTPDKIKGDFNV